MNILFDTRLRSGAVFALFIIANSSFALTEEDRQLARAAIPDSTPQEFYLTAINEAGGAYKESQKDCKAMQKTERSICLLEAKTLYDHDMAEAREMKRNRSQQ